MHPQHVNTRDGYTQKEQNIREKNEEKKFIKQAIDSFF